MYGHPPPARLDFAYCKLSFVSKVAESVTCQATDGDKSNEEGSCDLVNLKKIQELNLGDFGNDIQEDLSDEANDSSKGEQKIPESKTEEKTSTADITAENFSTEKTPKGTGSVTSKVCSYLVIHGGMDTEGNVHEDMFLISPQ